MSASLSLDEKQSWVLGKVLADQARRRKDAPFLQYEDGPEISYSEAYESICRVAGGMADFGVGKGDRVLFMMRNSIEIVYTWFAANLLGAVQVPVNTAYKGTFLEHTVNNCGAKIMVVQRNFLDRLKAGEASFDHLEKIIVWTKPGDEDVPMPEFSKLEVSDFNDFYAYPAEPPECDVNYRDLAAILYTSGTTGPSKGVLLPHAHLYLYADIAVQGMKMTPDDIYYVCLPIFHANAQFLQIYPVLIAGAKAVIYDAFRASKWMAHARRHGATMASILAAMGEFIWKQPTRPDDLDNPLRVVICVPLTGATEMAFEERFGFKCISAYGMTEIATPLVHPYDEPPRPGSCGKVLSDWFEVKIVDPETDEDLPPGQLGEIVIRHKYPWTLNLGYHNLPEKTLEAWRNLWFHTGDAGKCDEDGYFYFVDRLKDYIRHKGENISSFEIERVVNSHASVHESAAVGIRLKDRGGEDEVKICVVLRPGEKLGPEALLDYCQEHMPYFAVPRYVEFINELPKTQTEKVQKHKLRDAGIATGTWDREKAGYRVRKG
ncbi:MAG: AMP-binding protein [Deltaproteobacteria bacterium]|nr:AMP-binding protein [Deltaproteobacteria bacterium]